MSDGRRAGGLDSDGGRPSAAPQQPAAAGLHRRKARLLHEQGPYLRPGETVEKQLILINNSPGDRVVRVRMVVRICRRPRPATRRFPLPTGEQERIPLRFELPAALPAGNLRPHRNASASAAARRRKTLSRSTSCRARAEFGGQGKIALFDPKGETGQAPDWPERAVSRRWQPTPTCRATTC